MFLNLLILNGFGELAVHDQEVGRGGVPITYNAPPREGRTRAFIFEGHCSAPMQ